MNSIKETERCNPSACGLLQELAGTEPDRVREIIRNRVLGAPDALRAFYDIDDPENRSMLQEFHAMLMRYFRPGEIEPLEVFEREMQRNKNPESPARFICVTAKDFITGRIISGAYGSVQDEIMAMRFTLTEAQCCGVGQQSGHYGRGSKGFRGYRGTGISQAVDAKFFEAAGCVAAEQDGTIQAGVGECVDLSESYWNRTWGIKRLYKPGTTEEIHYRLPPLCWNRDGTPASEDVITEHLQVAVNQYPQYLPVTVLEGILKKWWEAWYIRPPETFENTESFERHRRTVFGILESEIIGPLRTCGILDCLTRDEREAKEKTSR